MLVECHTVFDSMAEFDPATGELSYFSRSRNPVRAQQRLCGHYDAIGVKLALLFRLDGCLYLQIDKRRIMMDRCWLALREKDGQRVLHVLEDHALAFELIYDAPIIDPPLSQDITPFVEEEHFDFGLFLANVSRDSGRQSRLYS